MNSNLYASLQLKQLRKTLNKTQEQIAFEPHIDQSAYSRYENGRTQLPVSFIQQVSEKYNVDPSYFFSAPGPASALPLKSRDNAEKYYALPKEMIDKFILLMERIHEKIDPPA